MAGATLTLTAPRTPGTYNVRWFAQDGFTRLAISADVTVTAPPAPTVTITTPTVSGGGAIGFTVANGPGRIAFSRNAPGEMVVLPLHPGMELDVREHAFLLASHTIQYSFIRIKGLVNLLHGGNGMYMDRFVTAGYPGMLMLHGNGDVLERTLRPGEKILVEPGGFLYKDSTVQMQAVQMPLKTGLLRHGMYLAEMTGPGRVGIQSMYVHHHAD